MAVLLMKGELAKAIEIIPSLDLTVLSKKSLNQKEPVLRGKRIRELYYKRTRKNKGP